MIYYFPGALSTQVAHYIHSMSDLRLEPIDPISNKQANTTPPQKVILVSPVLGDNEIPAEVTSWIKEHFQSQLYTIVLLADEDQHWRSKAVLYELISLFDHHGGRMLFKSAVLDSSQYRPYQPILQSWWSSLALLLSCDLSCMAELKRSACLSNFGSYHIDFRSQEYYQRATTHNLTLIRWLCQN